MEDLVRQLVDAGLVKPRDGANAAGTEGAKREEKPSSPNFSD